MGKQIINLTKVFGTYPEIEVSNEIFFDVESFKRALPGIDVDTLLKKAKRSTVNAEAGKETFELVNVILVLMVKDSSVI